MGIFKDFCVGIVIEVGPSVDYVDGHVEMTAI